MVAPQMAWPISEPVIAARQQMLEQLYAHRTISRRPVATGNTKMWTSRCFGAGAERSLKRVRDSIEASRYVLALSRDWDGEGATPIAVETWRRATEFLSRNAEALWAAHGVQVYAPRILPVPDGSLDIHWKTIRLNIMATTRMGAKSSKETWIQRRRITGY